MRIGTRAEAIDLDAGEVVAAGGRAPRLRQPRRRHRRAPAAPAGARAGRRRRARRPPAGRRRRHPGRHRRGREAGRRPRRWLHRPGDGRGAADPRARRSPSSSPTRCRWRSSTTTWASGSARPWATWASTCRPSQPVREIEVDADGVVAGGAHRRGQLRRRPRRPRPGHGPGGDAGAGGRAAARRHRRRSTSRTPSAAARTPRSSPPATARRPSTGSPARRIHVALGTHANKQGRVAGLGHRRPAGPLRRRPGDGDDEGRRPRGGAHRAVHHPGRGGRLRLPHRDDRGDDAGRLLPGRRADRGQAASPSAGPGCCSARRSSAGRAAASGSTSWPPPSGPG